MELNAKKTQNSRINGAQARRKCQASKAVQELAKLKILFADANLNIL